MAVGEGTPGGEAPQVVPLGAGPTAPCGLVGLAAEALREGLAFGGPDAVAVDECPGLVGQAAGGLAGDRHEQGVQPPSRAGVVRAGLLRHGGRGRVQRAQQHGHSAERGHALAEFGDIA